METFEKGEKWLSHHGVLGQKWGVRNDESAERENKTATSTSKSVKVSETEDTKLKTGDVVVLGIGGVSAVGIFGPSVVSAAGAPLYLNAVKKDLKSISEHTAAIDKANDFLNNPKNTDVPMGTVFHRVASYKESEVNAPKYATYLDSDVLKYRQTWITPGRTSFNAHYVTKMEATRPVTIASPESVLKTIQAHMHELLDDGETLAQKFERVATPLDTMYGPTNKYGAIKKWSDVEPSLLANYIVGHNRSEIWADDVGKATSEIMQKAGYAAVTDINNTGSQARKHAVIILDKTAFDVTSKRLTGFERSAAGIARSSLAKKAAKAALAKV